jgi:DNA-binding LacI/PurR family transcriptional regulator
MVTARQVAEESGFAISTVGRALADDSRISATTKAKIRIVADRLGYVENTPARIMRGGSSKLVGLMLPDVRNDFYAMIAEALSHCCDAEGYQLALSIADERDAEARHLKELISARVAGILIVPTPMPKRETLALLRNVPHVQLLRRIASSTASWFGIDDEDCLHTGTGHLIALGHSRIAYVGGSADLSTGAARVKGFRRAFTEAGVDRRHAIEELGSPTREFGEGTVRGLMALAERPTAIISGSVQVTQAMLDSLHELDISVPDDLSVVGFGDAPGFDWWGPGLTTLRMPIQSLATTCGLWFIRRIKEGTESNKPHASIVPAQLIERGSTASALFKSSSTRLSKSRRSRNADPNTSMVGPRESR